MSMQAQTQYGFLSLSLLVCPPLLVAMGLRIRWLPLKKFETRLMIRKLAALVAGMGVVWIVSASRWSGFDHCLLTFHMVGHLLLMIVAAPLILYGASLSLASTDRSRPLLRFIFQPTWCWFAAAAAVIGWHMPAVFELALHSRGGHILEGGSFLAAGLLFWFPVMRAGRSAENDNEWFVPLYLFLATIPCDILSAFLVFCGRVVYPSYRLITPPFGFTALNDQQFAGALMWITVTFAYLIPATVITVQKLSPSRTSVQWKGGQPDLRTVSLRSHPVPQAISSQVEDF